MFSTWWQRRCSGRKPLSNTFRALHLWGNRWRPALEVLECRTLPSAASPVSEQIANAYGQIPLSFEANQGQTVPQVQFLSHGSGYTLFLTSQEAVLSLIAPPPAGSGSAAKPPTTGDVLEMQLVGSNSGSPGMGLEKQATISNYFIGNNPSQWHTSVPNYGQVQFSDVYPGINVIYYGKQRQLEYDFDVSPETTPGVIQLQFQGAESMSLDASGDLVLHTSGGDVVEHAPVAYQVSGGSRQGVAAAYVLEGGDQVGFRLGAYDPSLPLVIDPVLSYSTYLGGSGTAHANAMAVDSSGDVYITGYTVELTFPTTAGAFQTSFAIMTNGSNAFVTKLNATGTALIYSTYLGGSGGGGNFVPFDGDGGAGIAVDSSGDAYVTGYTYSTDFPTTAGAFQTAFANTTGGSNAFITKLNATGTGLIYSTYLGGSGSGEYYGIGYVGDGGTGIAVDSSSDAYVTGQTYSSNFPTTAGAFQTSLAETTNGSNAFITKLNATGTGLIYSTYLGGSGSGSYGDDPDGDGGRGIAVNSSGDAYVTGYTDSSNFPTTAGAFQTSLGGQNAFITKLNATGTGLIYSTYLGGSIQDGGTGIAVDSSGDAYVTGYTESSNFPTTAGAFQTSPAATYGYVYHAFVTKLNATGTGLIYSTYLGGSMQDIGAGIAVDSSGDAYVTGSTDSSDFPTTAGAFQTSLPNTTGGSSAFVTKLNATGIGLVYSTYLGGNGGGYPGGDGGAGIAVDSSGDAYVTGYTESSNFPTTSSAFQSVNNGGVDAFVAKFSALSPITVTPTQSLQQAVAMANQSPGTSIINFALGPGMQTIVLSAPVVCTTSVIIDGTPASQYPSQQVTIDPPHTGPDISAADHGIDDAPQVASESLVESVFGTGVPVKPSFSNSSEDTVRNGGAAIGTNVGTEDSIPGTSSGILATRHSPLVTTLTSDAARPNANAGMIDHPTTQTTFTAPGTVNLGSANNVVVLQIKAGARIDAAPRARLFLVDLIFANPDPGIDLLPGGDRSIPPPAPSTPNPFAGNATQDSAVGPQAEYRAEVIFSRGAPEVVSLGQLVAMVLEPLPDLDLLAQIDRMAPA